MGDRDIERRYLASPVQFRAAEDGPGMLFGYAATYNSYSQNLGGFVEAVAPGAFDKSLADAVRVLCRGNHSDNHLLGTSDAGTLRLSSDGTGLPYEVDLPDTTSGRDFGVLAARGDVRYSSFAFRCIEDEWGVTDQGFPLRTLKQVLLVDVAPVNNPAYLDTSVGKRSLATILDVDLDRLVAMELDEIRSALTGAPNEQEKEAEQRETHSAAISVQAKLLDLDALK